MKTFSIMDATASAFRVVGQRPVATLVWGLVLLAPGLLVLGMMIPFFGEIAASGALEADAVEAGADAEAVMFGDDFGAMLQFQIWSQVANLVQLFGLLFVTTAIIRSVFADRRGDPAFFLRLGKSEFLVAVIGVAVGVGFAVLAMITALLAVGVGFGLWQFADPWRVLACIGLGVVVLLGLLMLWGRLALLAPASIHYRTFAFEEGWKLGKGKTWSLLGLALILFLIAVIVGIVCMTVLLVVGLAIGGGVQATDPQAVEAWFNSLSQRPGLLAGVAAVLLLPIAWLQGFSQVLFTAPYAHIVQTLAVPATSSETVANSADTPADAH